ncbi:MAG: cyclophilin-like fold protein [Clostridia bacterium]|nr:cyclophilin-like fold protein [Clostridia bacterium]
MKSKKKLLSTAIMAAVIFSTSVQAAVFRDVSDNSPYSDAVEYCTNNGLMSGTSDTEFSPDDYTSRAMLVTILYRHQGNPETNGTVSFEDVTEGSWYYDAVKWASSNNIVSGYDAAHFGPTDLLTREQILSMLWRISGSPEVSSDISYSDRENISTYAETAVKWAIESNIIDNSDNTLKPKEYISRGELALMLYNMLNEENKTSDTTDETATSQISESDTTPDIHVTFNNSEFDVVLYSSPLSIALLEEVPETPMMLPPSYDEDGVYKYYDLPWTLDIVSENIREAKAGDILLNNEGRLFLYYADGELDGSFMRIGYVSDTTNLAENLGSGAVNFYVSQYE